ncbi:MAG: hypothetical protein J3K34DRAFT_413793 [Monoraphidium minutum]|nr:MAG: hypothetical protein J3K34DRAFT_413793 [Monoraphidium minutum]
MGERRCCATSQQVLVGCCQSPHDQAGTRLLVLGLIPTCAAPPASQSGLMAGSLQVNVPSQQAAGRRQGRPRLCSTSSGGRACSAQRRPAAARRVVGCEHAGDCLRRRRWWRCVQRLEAIARRVLPYTSFTHPHADVRAVRGCRDACGGWGQGCGCTRIQLPAGSQSELGLRWWLGAVCVVHCGGGKVCKAHQAAAFPLSLRAVCVQGAVCVRARVFSGRGP